MKALKCWFLCMVWHGGRHDWKWINSINEKNPSHYRCARCGTRG